MGLVQCENCGKVLRSEAPACDYCGRRAVPAAELPNSPTDSAPFAGDLMPPPDAGTAPLAEPFFDVSTQKFIVLCIFSFGIYEIYWFYQNWKRIKQASGSKLSPFWRAFFAPFTAFSLFQMIRTAALERQVATEWSPRILGIFYFVSNTLWRLPEPWSYLSFLSVFALLPVHRATQRVNDTYPAAARGERNGRYSKGNIVIIILGALLFAFAIFGEALPDE